MSDAIEKARDCLLYLVSEPGEPLISRQTMDEIAVGFEILQERYKAALAVVAEARKDGPEFSHYELQTKVRAYDDALKDKEPGEIERCEATVDNIYENIVRSRAADMGLDEASLAEAVKIGEPSYGDEPGDQVANPGPPMSRVAAEVEAGSDVVAEEVDMSNKTEFECLECGKSFEAPWDFGDDVECGHCHATFETDYEVDADENVSGPWLVP